MKLQLLAFALIATSLLAIPDSSSDQKQRVLIAKKEALIRRFNNNGTIEKEMLDEIRFFQTFAGKEIPVEEITSRIDSCFNHNWNEQAFLVFLSQGKAKFKEVQKRKREFDKKVIPFKIKLAQILLEDKPDELEQLDPFNHWLDKEDLFFRLKVWISLL